MHVCHDYLFWYKFAQQRNVWSEGEITLRTLSFNTAIASWKQLFDLDVDVGPHTSTHIGRESQVFRPQSDRHSHAVPDEPI